MSEDVSQKGPQANTNQVVDSFSPFPLMFLDEACFSVSSFAASEVFFVNQKSSHQRNERIPLFRGGGDQFETMASTDGRLGISVLDIEFDVGERHDGD